MPDDNDQLTADDIINQVNHLTSIIPMPMPPIAMKDLNEAHQMIANGVHGSGCTASMHTVFLSVFRFPPEWERTADTEVQGMGLVIVSANSHTQANEAASETIDALRKLVPVPQWAPSVPTPTNTESLGEWMQWLHDFINGTTTDENPFDFSPYFSNEPLDGFIYSLTTEMRGRGLTRYVAWASSSDGAMLDSTVERMSRIFTPDGD